MAEFNILACIDKLTPDGGRNSLTGDHSFFCPACKAHNFKVHIHTGKWACFGCSCSENEDGKRKIRDILSPAKSEHSGCLPFSESHSVYTYHDRTGNPVLLIHRIDSPSRPKKIWQSVPPNCQGLADVRDARSRVVPYRFHDISVNLNDPDRLIYWVEGEKCAEAMWTLGLQAITTVGGCSGYSSTRDAGHVPGHRLIVVPDLDAPGIKYAQQIIDDHPGARLLFPFYDQPEMHSGYPKQGGLDIADWIAQGASIDLIEGGITTSITLSDQALAPSATTAQAPYVVSKRLTYTELLDSMLVATINGDDDTLMTLRAEEAIARYRFNDSKIEALLFQHHTRQQSAVHLAPPPDSLDLSRISGMDYLIHGFVPDNDQTLLFGDAGSGKTTAALAMVIALLLGIGMLDHVQPARLGKVLFIASDSGASPLYAAMQDMGIADLPEAQQGPDQRLFVWASDPEQGMQAWSADLRGCIRLLEFVKRHQIDLVIIDSCKAVCSGAGLDYTNNQLVTSLLTYFKEVICPHTAVVWLNHDGVAKGAHAGAKAWKEIPSMVHRISKEEQKDGSIVNSRRHWSVTKSRMGPGRDFDYQLNHGELTVCANQEVVGNCLARVVDVLAGALQLEGKDSLSRADLAQRVCSHGGPSQKTLDNTLSTATKAKHPEVCRAGHGRYKLAPRIAEALKGCVLNGK
jgi:hypothetical protein